LIDWLISECHRAGVGVELNTAVDLRAAPSSTEVIIQATGSVPGVRTYSEQHHDMVLDVLDVRSGAVTLPADGKIVLFDPIGGPIAVALAEQLGERAVLITQDNIAGNELSRTGDLAPANVRLAQRGVQIERRSLLREVHTSHVVVEDRFTADRRDIACTAVVDCGFRLPTDALPGVHLQAGDCVAPRTIYEAILEGRRAALAIDHV
jgi:2,4-dienoyl-CoA reductase (NADPH2)